MQCNACDGLQTLPLAGTAHTRPLSSACRTAGPRPPPCGHMLERERERDRAVSASWQACMRAVHGLASPVGLAAAICPRRRASACPALTLVALRLPAGRSLMWAGKTWGHAVEAQGALPRFQKSSGRIPRAPPPGCQRSRAAASGCATAARAGGRGRQRRRWGSAALRPPPPCGRRHLRRWWMCWVSRGPPAAPPRRLRCGPRPRAGRRHRAPRCAKSGRTGATATRSRQRSALSASSRCLHARMHAGARMLEA